MRYKATAMSEPRIVRARGARSFHARAGVQEAAFRMLQNNLDPEVAERPNDLVVYGGTGKARARGKPSTCSSASFASSGNDETLLVQSGKSGGPLSHAPRCAAHPDRQFELGPQMGHLGRVPAAGSARLTMFGQMTAGSWIYIGSQGILQGTYETFVPRAKPTRTVPRAVARRGCSRRARRNGRRAPLAATMAGISCLAVEVDPSRIGKRLETHYLDVRIDDLDRRRSPASRRPRRAGSP